MNKKLTELIALQKDKFEQEQQIALQRTMEDVLPEVIVNTIDIEECNEPLVRIVDYVPNVIIYFKEDRKVEGEDTLYARESVAEQLSEIAKDIAPLRLKVYDAFRPFEVQERWYNRICNEIKANDSSLSLEQIQLKAFNFIFPPSLDPLKPAAHSTGGAIDLTLTYDNGEELDMGSEIRGFDCPAIITNANCISEKQKDNRIMLIEAMTKRNFVNFPGEWWHFSMGDREWVAYLGLNKPAIYGGRENPYKTRSLA
ncbi:hypothetical protein HOC35_00160 [Candidatus Woesearchaeota archaeon]|jgi:zinc D-Ala-D-Ala dipeptidase|nr:hypothetical protein [Candidatus Woesearchaeota archaeon]